MARSVQTTQGSHVKTDGEITLPETGSLFMWFSIDSNSPPGGARYWVDSASYAMQIRMATADDKWRARIYWASTGGDTTGFDGVTYDDLTTEAWHSLCFTWITSSTCVFYVDNVALQTYTQGDSDQYDDLTQVVAFGAPVGSGALFDGAFGEIAVWNSVLSSDDRAALQSYTRPNKITATPIYYWPLVDSLTATVGGVDLVNEYGGSDGYVTHPSMNDGATTFTPRIIMIS